MPAITKSTTILNNSKTTSNNNFLNNNNININNNNNRHAKSEVTNGGPITSDKIPEPSRTKNEAPRTNQSGLLAAVGGQKCSEESLLELANKTKYDIVQYNGQRIYGSPPPDWTGPTPPKGSEVFVGRVPRECSESELVPIFERIGPIFELRLMLNFTGCHRGFVFVRYTNREDAKRAVRELNNYEIRPNKYLGVTPSVDNCKLWISGIPKNCSAQDIKIEMERLTEGVRDVILYTSQIDKSKTRGYAFVEYESHRAAALARRKLVPGRVVLMGHEIDKIDWAEPENEVDEEIMATVRVLFIRNLMPSTSEDAIRRIFADLGGSASCVERVKKMKDYAFVHFVNRDSAEKAIRAAQNLFLEGSKIEVSWSKPVDKQIYNMRKQLTKVLSSPASAPIQPPVHPMSPMIFPPMFTRSPRRRGAAGIKGLGAPGTVPLRGLVRKFASVNPELDPNHNSKLVGPLLSPPMFANQHHQQSLIQDYCNNDLYKMWVESAQHMVSESDEAGFTRNFYQSGFPGHHPMAIAAMFAAMNPGGFFPSPMAPGHPGCMTMIPQQGSGGPNSNGSFSDLDQLGGALVNMSLQNA